jgi:hypothetical protein
MRSGCSRPQHLPCSSDRGRGSPAPASGCAVSRPPSLPPLSLHTRPARARSARRSAGQPRSALIGAGAPSAAGDSTSTCNQGPGRWGHRPRGHRQQDLLGGTSMPVDPRSTRPADSSSRTSRGRARPVRAGGSPRAANPTDPSRRRLAPGDRRSRALPASQRAPRPRPAGTGEGASAFRRYGRLAGR